MDVPRSVWIVTTWSLGSPDRFVGAFATFQDVKTYMWRTRGVIENEDVWLRHDRHVFGRESEFVAFETEIHRGV
jgi:hypothetical protein